MGRLLRLIVYLGISTLLLGASVIPPGEELERIRAFTRQIEFDYVAWTLNALVVKWSQWALGGAAPLAAAEQSQAVRDYLALIGEIEAAEARLAQVYTDPAVSDPPAAAQALRSQLEALQAQRARLGPLAESVIQAQLSAVLADSGLTLAGQPAPPVLYHITPPPKALIVSPRGAIRQDANLSISADLSLEAVVALEDSAAQALDRSTLVVGIGGVGVYPTMVMQTTDLNWLAEVVAHEWVHNYLTLRPLGVNYETSPELRLINETVAGIAGKELGRALVARYYPDLLPPDPQPETAPAAPVDPAQPPPFDFRAEMRHTRLAVDRLLAQGEIEKAERYMELRRRYLWDNSYPIRKLNQAYFAFYGAYADQPGGAAGEDPLGAAVRALRAGSASLADFLNRVAWMWSPEQLHKAAGGG
jgi:hypothetical protein